MRFGLSLPIVQQVPGRGQAWEAGAGAAELIRVARAADYLGFDHVSACDHVAVPHASAATLGPTWYDATVTLSFLAAVTTRVRLLSHVMVLPYRHPLVVAKAFATLDHLSAGRVILGVGSGHLKPEFRSLGADYATRGLFTDEAVQAVGIAWETAPATFEGCFVRFRDVTVAPRPHQRPRPPIWVGGNSPAAVRRAARYADGWIPWSSTPTEFGRLSAYAHEVRQQTGRPTTFESVAPLTIGTDDTDALIAARIETWVAAGATAFHVGIAHTNLEHLLERMTRFAEVTHLAPDTSTAGR